ncbi:hypothetical protein ABZ400_35835 [Streptomyces sp. NPDC005897]|uniref:hypothetical protein n=1 Tax=Streptomyces sp. NPDC005897 TaxID=3157081 RepID=UPI0033EF48F9
MTEPRAPQARQAKRAARAAAAGVVAVAAAGLSMRLVVNSSACRSAPGFGCLGYALWWSYLLPVLVFGLTWLVLRLLAVRPAWLTALLGTGIGWYLLWCLDSLRWLPNGTLLLQAALCAGAFALAAWCTQSRRPLWPRAAAALALALLMPLDSLATTQFAGHAQNSELAAARVPLLGPNVPDGYHLEGVGTSGSTSGSQPTFFYRIALDDAGQHADSMEELHRVIQVVVGPRLPNFTPPSHCAALTSVYPVPAPACTPIAPGVWRWSRDDFVQYFTRVGDAVAVVEARTPPVSSALLRNIASSMRVRAPAYFSAQ